MQIPSFLGNADKIFLPITTILGANKTMNTVYALHFR